MNASLLPGRGDPVAVVKFIDFKIENWVWINHVSPLQSQGSWNPGKHTQPSPITSQLQWGRIIGSHLARWQQEKLPVLCCWFGAVVTRLSVGPERSQEYAISKKKVECAVLPLLELRSANTWVRGGTNSQLGPKEKGKPFLNLTEPRWTSDLNRDEVFQ